MMPIGGKTLTSMRLRGGRPAGFITVTESGDVASYFRHPDRGMFVLMFEPGTAYDWQVIHGLDVILHTYCKREEVSDLCKGILEAEPLSFHAKYQTTDEYDTVIPFARVA